MGGTDQTILVVDDDPSLRLLCRVNLELEGFSVLEAATLAEARAALAAGGVDVVLLDLHVGNERGDELLMELVARAVRPRVALLTGSAEVERGHRQASDSVIRKPFTLEELAETVHRLAQKPVSALDVDS